MIIMALSQYRKHSKPQEQRDCQTDEAGKLGVDNLHDEEEKQ